MNLNTKWEEVFNRWYPNSGNWLYHFDFESLVNRNNVVNNYGG